MAEYLERGKTSVEGRGPHGIEYQVDAPTVRSLLAGGEEILTTAINNPGRTKFECLLLLATSTHGSNRYSACFDSELRAAETDPTADSMYEHDPARF